MRAKINGMTMFIKKLKLTTFKNVVFLCALLLYCTALLLEFQAMLMPYLKLLFILSYCLLGYGILKEALFRILKREYFNENSLMAIASLGAFYVGDGAEAVAILLFYRVGEFLEDLIVERSKRQIRSLANLKVEMARVLQGDAYCLIAPESLQENDVLVVFAGERILCDGVVLKGGGSIDTSALSGEAIAQNVQIGDAVLSGSINLEGVLQIQAKRSYANSTFARVLKLIEEGSAQKSKSEEFITKFARIYTPVVTFLAFCVAVIPPFALTLAGGNFFEALQTWLYRGIIFLVVSCPCALVISIPLTFFAALGRASKDGVLIKGSSYLEALNALSAIVFDKTGTITSGRVELKAIHPFEGFSSSFVLSLAKALEAHSNHPIAKAILAVPSRSEEIFLEDVKEFAGGGISAHCTINDNGQLKKGLLSLGNAGFINAQSAQNITESKEAKCEIFLSFKGKHIATFILEDTLKSDAKDAIAALSSLDLYLLSGDKQALTQKIAKEVGIIKYFAPLLPEDKVMHLKEVLKTHKGKKVAFVGDGINDAPALALSDVGIAMGSGSDVALESADIVILHNDLQKIPKLLKLARKTRSILWQNITFALGIKGGIMLFGMFGIANVWIALFGDVGVALLALLNALRAMR